MFMSKPIFHYKILKGVLLPKARFRCPGLGRPAVPVLLLTECQIVIGFIWREVFEKTWVKSDKVVFGFSYFSFREEPLRAFQLLMFIVNQCSSFAVHCIPQTFVTTEPFS